MSLLAGGQALDGWALALEHDNLPDDAVVSGVPTAAMHPVSMLDGVEVGIWEMTPGVATDTETDEVFVVLSGRASIAFLDPPLPTLEIGPGSVVRLDEGMRTEWTVTETIRKVYIA